MILELLQSAAIGVLVALIGVLFLLILNLSSTYVNLTASRGFIRFLFQLAHLPVKLFNRMSSQSLYTTWEIEENPPSWLPPEVIKLKSSLTWKDRAYFWHLLLRSGTHAVHHNLGRKFLPRLVAHSIKYMGVTVLRVLFNAPQSLREFRAHPINAYLRLTGNFSGKAINWICRSPYKEAFIRTTRKAGFPIGLYYGKEYLKNPVFKFVENKTLRAMQFIMVVYVLFGLAGWEKHLYPRNEPKVIIHSKNYITVSFPGHPYRCPHRGLKCPAICQAFVSWEDGLVQAVSPQLTSYVGKCLAAGGRECEVIISEKKS